MMTDVDTAKISLNIELSVILLESRFLDARYLEIEHQLSESVLGAICETIARDRAFQITRRISERLGYATGDPLYHRGYWLGGLATLSRRQVLELERRRFETLQERWPERGALEASLRDDGSLSVRFRRETEEESPIGLEFRLINPIVSSGSFRGTWQETVTALTAASTLILNIYATASQPSPQGAIRVQGDGNVIVQVVERPERLSHLEREDMHETAIYDCTIMQTVIGDRREITRQAVDLLTGGHVQGRGDQMETVRARQRCMKALGIDPGPIDGVYGRKTRLAEAKLSDLLMGASIEWESRNFATAILTKVSASIHEPRHW